MTQELSPEQTAAIDKIQKLLNLSAKNPNEAEAAAAAAKAQELLAKFNLDVATVEQGAKKDGKREELKVEGGFYKFQRDLWRSLAQLNFCLHWVQQYRGEAIRYVDEYSGAKSMTPGEGKVRQKVSVIKNRHCLIGRMVNTRSTVVMAEYLTTAIERILDERLTEGLNERAKQSNWAQSFRRGATAKVVEMVQDRRREFVAKEEQAKRNAERAGHGVSTATALTLSVYVSEEHDANMDFLYGEGWSAKQAQERAQRAAEREQRLREYTAWAAANPEAAATKEAEEKAENAARAKSARSRWRGGRTERDNTDYSAYYSGYDAAKKISIDPQVDRSSSNVKRIGK